MEYCDEKPINACTNRWEVSILVGCVGHLDLIALGGEVAVAALYHLAVIAKLEKEKRSLELRHVELFEEFRGRL